VRRMTLVLLALSGCAGSGPEKTAPVATPGPVAAFEIDADRSAAECEALMADPRLDTIRSRLAVNRVDDQTPAMLANRVAPSPPERRLVRLWGEKRLGCRASSEAALKRLPRQLASVMRSGHDGVQSQVEKLAAGELSWGEFARRRAAIDSEMRGVWAEVETALLERNEQHASEMQADWTRRIEAISSGTLPATSAAYRPG
jgi:hypothetical protein